MITRTVLVCAVLAALSVAAGVAAGHPAEGGGLALGLLIGSANGALVLRAVRADAGFSSTSLGRLAVLSAAGVGAGLLLGGGALPLALLGLAAAQLVLALTAGLRMARA